jgi:hypothetical protein
MNNEELVNYRVKLVKDAVRMQGRPDKTPHMANFWSWPILDAGYKLSEATHNYDILEKCIVRFAKKYEFDLHIIYGTRNISRVTDLLGGGFISIDDEKEMIVNKDHRILNSDEYDEFVEDVEKFVWSKALPREFKKFNSNLTLDEFIEVAKEFKRFTDFRTHISKRLREECGLPNAVADTTTPGLVTGFEYLFCYLTGIKGTSIDLRRKADKVKYVCQSLDESMLMPVVDAIMDGEQGSDPSRPFDYIITMMGSTVLSAKQFGELYWPAFKKLCDAIVAKDKMIYIFIEGDSKRFWEYFQELPKGHFAVGLEQDDPYEFRKALPNLAIIGGMDTSLLGGGTPDECVAAAQKAIDELGGDGGLILSQNKMISFRNDVKPENLKAVCDFVKDYRG